MTMLVHLKTKVRDVPYSFMSICNGILTQKRPTGRKVAVYEQSDSTNINRKKIPAEPKT